MKSCSNISQVVVLTKNTKLSNEDRFAEILVELHGIEWDIVLFTETRMQSETLELQDGHILFESGCKDLPTGVAILVHRKYQASNLKAMLINDRIIALNLRMHNQRFKIRSSYLPHDGYGDAVYQTYQE